MPNVPKNQVSPSIKTCDHCNQERKVLWIDNAHWMLCPECWPMYHIPSHYRQRLINQYLAQKEK